VKLRVGVRPAVEPSGSCRPSMSTSGQRRRPTDNSSDRSLTRCRHPNCYDGKVMQTGRPSSSMYGRSRPIAAGGGFLSERPVYFGTWRSLSPSRKLAMATSVVRTWPASTTPKRPVVVPAPGL